MAQMTESNFLSSDGRTELYYREYRPETEPKGIVQLVHGIAEHIARYDDFASFLADNGYIVAAHDQMGHGQSAGDPDTWGWFGEKDGWGKAVEDIHKLHDIMTSRYPGKPYFLLGHSMGSFLARTYIIRHRSGLDGAIISGTGHLNDVMILGSRVICAREIRLHGTRYRSGLLNRLAFGSYNKGFAGRTDFDWLTRDEKIVDNYVADPLCGFVATTGLMRDMTEGIYTITRTKKIELMNRNLPILFISGDKDPVGEQGKGVIRAYKAFLKCGMKDVTLKLYHDGRHEMLNELNKAEVYQDILSWLSGKTGA